VCSDGVRHLAELACATGATLLHASTSEVYGDPQEHPQKETYWGHVNPIGKRSCYDEGKRFAEALLMAYHDRRGVRTRLAAFSIRTAADARRRWPGVAKLHQPGPRRPALTVHGDGSRPQFLLRQRHGRRPAAPGGKRRDRTGQCRQPHEITMLQAAEEVIKLTGSRSKIAFVPRPPDDPCVRRPDITRAQTLLGWQPVVERPTASGGRSSG